MALRTLASSPSATVVGLLLLALWLGWVCAGFRAFGRRPDIDAAGLNQLKEHLQLNHPGLLQQQQAVAVLLSTCSCPSTEQEQAWRQLQAAMQQHGGRAVQLNSPAPGDVQLLLLNRHGEAIYAGPLQPSLAVCGQRQADLRDWLPGLLAGNQPPLHLPSSCTC